MIQFHDALILWEDDSQEYFVLWETFIETEWPDFARLFEQFLPKPLTRVIPVNKSIDSGKQKILDADSVDKIIEFAEEIAVANCPCGVIAHKCDKPLEVCLQVNNAARYTLDRGSGRELTKAEALTILRKCEDEGLVHVTMNKMHVGHFICNCCDCCCQALPLVIKEGIKICDPSRFQAVIDPDQCSFCKTCLDRCYFNALKLIETENGNETMSVIDDKCMGCGLCQITCPEEAISMIAVREEDFIPA